MNSMKSKKELLILILPILLMYSCSNKAHNTEIEKSTYVEQTEDKLDMILDSNCFFINDLTFDKKIDFFNFIEKQKKEFYSQPSSSPNEDYGMQYIYECLSYTFPLFSYWLEQKRYKPVSDSIFRARIREVFNIDLSDKCEKININKDYIEYITDYMDMDGFDVLSDGSFFFSPKYKLFFRPPAPIGYNHFYLVEEKSQTQHYKCLF